MLGPASWMSTSSPGVMTDMLKLMLTASGIGPVISPPHEAELLAGVGARLRGR